MPDVAILANVKAAHGDPYFSAAKSGDPLSADSLVRNLIGPTKFALVRKLVGSAKPILCPVHALETTGVNEIPLALAGAVSRELGLTVETSIIQDNTVGHTGADGWHRLANPALFSGDVTTGVDYLIVDDFVGQGGTVANLAGFIRSNGGNVIGVVTLTGQDYSARLAPDPELIRVIRKKHGQHLELWWQEQFGYGFDCLTHSEARYLARIPDADTIRARLLAARQEGVVESDHGTENSVG
jgi:hypothetical protein